MRGDACLAGIAAGFLSDVPNCRRMARRCHRASKHVDGCVAQLSHERLCGSAELRLEPGAGVAGSGAGGCLQGRQLLQLHPTLAHLG